MTIRYTLDGAEPAVSSPAYSAPISVSESKIVKSIAIDTAGNVSDVARGEYVINGQKAAWVSNGTIATHALTYLTLDPSKGMAGGGVAFIPLNLPGVSKGKPVDKMGQRALNQGSIHFANVRIPKRHMLFDTGSYEAILQQTLVLTNGAMGAVFTGVARAAYEQALAYTKTRLQGGKPICEHQLVQKHLFDMFTKVETSRALSRAAMAYNATAQPPAHWMKRPCSICARAA